MKNKGLTLEQLDKAAIMLKAIAHPMRIEIVNQLVDGKKLTVTEIHEMLDIEQSTASHHLGILKDKGVLTCIREGKNIYYSLKLDKISMIIECMKKCV